MTEKLEIKENNLIDFIKQYARVAVAFSGGVDSSVVLAACKRAGVEVFPVFADSVAVPAFEKTDAYRVGEETKTKLVVIKHDPLLVPEFCENGPRRCYFCKKALLKALKRQSEKLGAQVIFDGGNLDDCGDYRPGMQAVKEEGIVSPLLNCRLNKAEVRTLAKKYGLSVADKPAYACLASRMAYGETITAEKLTKVEKAEDALFRLGIQGGRVRCHGDLARIEIPPEALEQVFLAHREELVQAVKAAGFLFITLDLEGYRTGSMNTLLK